MLVCLFGLPIYLGMVSSAQVLLDFELCTQLLEECGGEAWVPIRDDTLWESRIRENPVFVESSHSFCINCFVAGYEDHCLGTVMIGDCYDGVISSGKGQFDNEVNCYSLKRKRLSLWRNRVQRGIIAMCDGFVGLANSTALHILAHKFFAVWPPVLF